MGAAIGTLCTLVLVLMGSAFAANNVSVQDSSVSVIQTFGAANATRRTTLQATPSIATPVAINSPSSEPHIMLIVEENECITTTSKCTGVLGGTGTGCGGVCAPYVTGLASTYASATNWYGVQHNSPHDYLDLIVGSDLGLPNNQPYSNTTLVDELHSANIPWVSYMETMPSDCFSGTIASGLYDPNHNPFHYFVNYKSSAPPAQRWCGSSNLSTEGVVPYPGASGIANALNSGDPDFVYLVPNDCDDMHGDTTPGSGCSSDANNQLIMAGDTWLSNNLPNVLNSSWFKANGTVIVTWDESVSSDSSGCCGLSSPGGHIPTLVISTSSKGLGNFTGTGDHYGTLRAIEEQYGVGLLGGSKSTAGGDLTGAFGNNGSISGSVIDDASKVGISGATVSYSGGGNSGTTTTSANGGYSLTAVPPGTYTVTASAAGHATGTVNGVKVTAGSNPTVNFSLTPNSGSISGTVFDTQNPAHVVTTATVSYTGSNGSGTTSTINPATGAYALTNVPAGSYTVTATANGYTTQTKTSVSVTTGNPTTANFTMPATSSITGTVLDNQTPPQAVTTATVTYSGPNGSGSTNTINATTGAYTLSGVPPGTYTVTATATGYTTQQTTGVIVTAGNATSANFAMPATSSITGTVLDTQSPQDAVTTATVSYSGPEGSGSTSTINATTGQYTLSSVPAGTYTVTATANGYTTQQTAGVLVTAGNATTTNFTMPATSSIDGEVTDSVSGDAVTGATVSYSGPNGAGSTSAIDPSTGAYALSGVPAGTYTVTASAPGYATQQDAGVIVAPGDQTGGVNFSLLATSGSISGTVSDGNGPLGPPEAATVTYGGAGGTNTTMTDDSNGDYSLTDVPAGIYQVTASFSNDVPQTFDVTVTASANSSQSFVLTAGLNGSITGYVSDAQTSAPLANVTVNDGTDPSVTTDTNGFYAINPGTGVTPDNYTLTFAAPNYVGTSHPINVTASADTTQNASLTEDGTITGSVTDAITHSAIQDAGVTCSCGAPPTMTDTSGKYAFTGVTPGSGYTVSVTGTGYNGQTTGPLTVNPGAPTTQNFQLSKLLSVAETFGARNTTGSTTLAKAPSTPTGAGDLLVAAIKLRVGTGAVTVSSVTDSAGNVWTRGRSVSEGSGLNDEEIWYVAASASVSSTQMNPGVTVTTTRSAAISFTVLDVVGASALDSAGVKSNSGTNSTPQPSVGPTGTTTQANEIVIGDIGWNNLNVTLTSQAFTPSVSPTFLPQQQSTVSGLVTYEDAGYQIVSSTGMWNFSGTLSSTSAWTGIIATFH